MRSQVIGIIVATVGAVTLVSLLSSDEGALSTAWTMLLRRVFGVGVYPVALMVFAGGLFLVFRDALEVRFQPRWQTVVGAEAAFVLFLGLVHVLITGDPLELARAGKAGGYIGWAQWQITVPWIGPALSAALLVLLILVAAGIAAGITWRMVLWRIQWIWAQVGTRVRRMITARRLRRIAASASDVAPDLATVSSATTVSAAGEARRRAGRTPRSANDRLPVRAEALPPLELLIPDVAAGGDDAGARHQAQVIEETLSAFGIPAQVVEWSKGPSVTQFGVEPGYVERNDRRYKVRVSKIWPFKTTWRWRWRLRLSVWRPLCPAGPWWASRCPTPKRPSWD